MELARLPWLPIDSEDVLPLPPLLGFESMETVGAIATDVFEPVELVGHVLGGVVASVGEELPEVGVAHGGHWQHVQGGHHLVRALVVQQGLVI